jgi:uncharacterized protein YbjT (DUF2867 family)
MRVLILGGNGFIGSEVCRVLAGGGHAVTALARDPGKVALRLPGVGWLRRDLTEMCEPSAWACLADFDAVVNCAGALQDGAGDDVASVQRDAMLALYAAARERGLGLVVQISARTDGPGAETSFLASKRAADAALAESGVPFVIIRPAIVVGRNAYGGTVLLRALAAMPWRTALVGADAPMQFAALSDVASAVKDAISGTIAPGSDIALAAPETMTLRDAVALHRAWLGLPPAPTIAVPPSFAEPVAVTADLLGRLGWRSPLRSTAMEIGAGGARAASGGLARSSASLAETLAANPAGAQDLWFARLYLLKPLIVAVLALFWLVSGLIALARFEASSAIMAAGIGSDAVARFLTLVTGTADILLGLAVVVRRFARPALLGMVGLSLAYLAAATLLTPTLWADPLGPLVKVVPSTVLALVGLSILDER